MELFTTTLDLYGGVLWSGELQGFIIHERMPTSEARSAFLLNARFDTAQVQLSRFPTPHAGIAG